MTKHKHVRLSDAEREEGLAALRREVAATSMNAVAKKLGNYSRPAISMVLSGKYAGRPDALIKRVLEVFGDPVECPHLRKPISHADCRDHAGRPMPTGSRAALAHWEACQSCPLRPGGEPC